MWRVRVGTLFGIPVRLDATFLLVLPLFAGVIGARIERTAGVFNEVAGAGLAVEALAAGPTPWLLGAVAALGLFAGVLAHEFGHSLVAMHYGYEIDGITLWLFGGLAQLTDLPDQWRRELAIAVAGPLVSVGVGLVCAGLYLGAPAGLDGPRFVLLYLALLNVALAGFNMLPAFPMDGGRVLRALLGRRRSFERATDIAATVGKGFAALLGLVGVARLDPIMAGIAIFVYVAATSEARQVSTRAALDGVAVRDVMTPVGRLDVVTPETSVEALFGRMLRERHTGYPVVEGTEPVGVVTLSDAREVRSVERPAFTVREVMSRDLVTVAPDVDAMDALERMREEGVGRLLVVERDRLVGLVTRRDLTTAIEVLREGGDLEVVRGGPRSGPRA